MLYAIKERRKLNEARNKLKQCRDPYDCEIRELSKQDKKDKAEELWREMNAVCIYEEMQVQWLESRQLERQANKLLLDTPERSDETIGICQ